jgi:putative redox protein
MGMEATAKWNGKMSFTGTAGSGFTLPFDTSKESGGDDQGFRPIELLLVGLAGCTAMDVISILEKKRQDVTSFEVKVHGDRATDHPKIFTHIVVEYIVSGKALDPAAVERAVELSETKYCSASAMLRKAAVIEHKITLINE